MRWVGKPVCGPMRHLAVRVQDNGGEFNLWCGPYDEDGGPHRARRRFNLWCGPYDDLLEGVIGNAFVLAVGDSAEDALRQGMLDMMGSVLAVTTKALREPAPKAEAPPPAARGIVLRDGAPAA